MPPADTPRSVFAQKTGEPELRDTELRESFERSFGTVSRIFLSRIFRDCRGSCRLKQTGGKKKQETR
jgi:hypothetical protein